MVLSYHCKNANDDEDYDEGIKYYLIYPGSMKKVGGTRAMLIAVFEDVAFDAHHHQKTTNYVPEL